MREQTQNMGGGLNLEDAMKFFGGGTGGNAGASSVGALSGPAGGDALAGEPKGVQAALWANQEPSLLQTADAPTDSDYFFVDKSAETEASSVQDFGWVPSCCDVGQTRDAETGEELPCDYGG